MSIETFLQFLTQNNTLVIQVLITVVLVISALIIYRIYVAGDSAQEGGESTQHLEKTLQKFLELQSSGSVKSDSNVSSVDIEKLREEVLRLRAAVKEKDDKIAALETQLLAPSAGDGVSAEEKAKYEAKILDLEQRLAEYEIIAEDIADLARYREENSKLKEEIQKLKAGGAANSSEAVAPTEAVAASPSPTSAPTAAPAVDSPVPPSKPEMESPANPANVQKTLEVEAAAVVAAPAATSTEAPVTDELMAEFEAAVAQQKESSELSKAVPGAEVPEEERKKLLNDFESFVKKS